MLDALIQALPPGWQLGVILGVLGSHMMMMWRRTNTANKHLADIGQAAKMLNTMDHDRPTTPHVIAMLERTEEAVERLHAKLDELPRQLSVYHRRES